VTRPAEQRPELYVGVAVDTRRGRLAAEIRIEERLEDARVELAFEVHDVERDPELGRDPPGVIGGVERATALLELGIAVGDVVQPHPDTDDLVTLLMEERRRDGGVDPAGHRHQDPTHAGTPCPSGSAVTATVPSRIEATTRGTTSHATATSVIRRGAAERETERTARLVFGIAHRGQDVADLGRTGRAGRPHRTGDPLEVE